MKVILFSDKSRIQQEVRDILSSLEIDLVGVVTDNSFHTEDLPEADLLVSVCHHYKITREVIDKYPVCINFHPAPLPEYKGWAVYNFCLYNGENRWGVSAHHITDKIDAGNILDVLYFNIEEETVRTLRDKSHNKLLSLFGSVLTKFKNGEEFDSRANHGGEYYSKKMFESLREIKPEMSAREIKKRMHACWYPPHKGTYIKLDNQEFAILGMESYSDYTN